MSSIEIVFCKRFEPYTGTLVTHKIGKRKNFYIFLDAIMNDYKLMTRWVDHTGKIVWWTEESHHLEQFLRDGHFFQ